MGVYVSQKFVIQAPNERHNDIEAYVNSQDEVYFGEDSLGNDFFFTLSKMEWEQLKSFIDAQLKELET